MILYFGISILGSLLYAAIICPRHATSLGARSTQYLKYRRRRDRAEPEYSRTTIENCFRICREIRGGRLTTSTE